MIFDATSSELRREETLDYLRDNKFDRVLDVGGALGPWAKEFVTHYFDLKDIRTLTDPNSEIYENDYVKKAVSYVGDLDKEQSWQRFIDEDILFDFAICTQTLEHINSPNVALNYLLFIAKEGYIGVPSKFTELRKKVHYNSLDKWGGMTGFMRGFLPHKWLFTVREEVLWAWPKLPVLEHIHFDWIDDVPDEDFNYVELSFRWKNKIPFIIIDDEYLGFSDGKEFCTFVRKELPIGI